MKLLYFIASYNYNRCIDMLKDKLELLSIVGVFLRTDD